MARNSWKKLPDGTWAVSVFGDAGEKEGETVKVTRRDGRSANVTLGEPIQTSGKTTTYIVKDRDDAGQGEQAPGQQQHKDGQPDENPGRDQGDSKPAPGEQGQEQQGQEQQGQGEGEQSPDQGEGEGEGEQDDAQQDGQQQLPDEGEQGEGESPGEGEQEQKQDGPPEEFKPPKPTQEQKQQQFEAEQREEFKAEWLRLRDAVNEEEKVTGELVDSLESMRPYIEACRAFKQGITAKSMLDAMVMHWPEEAKRRHSANYKANPAKDGGNLGAEYHPLTGYVIKLAAARIPILMVGPAGVGKSHLSESVASFLGLPIEDCSMCAGATPSWLLGRWTMKPADDSADQWERQGYVHAGMRNMLVGGGVMVYEEFDSADANMLLVMNKALANDSFTNPISGERITKHEDFVPIANANTYGLGANSIYTGRNRLDAASIDRFRMGRVYIGLDVDLCIRIAEAQ